MKATLYEALGVSRFASQEEIRTALRGQIRKQYTSTRDGHGNVEEALRFINHASCILTDTRRRALYDQELAISDKSVEQRIQHVVESAMGRDGDKPASPIREDDPSTHTNARSPSALSSIHPGLVERVGSLPQATSVAIAACASFVVLIAIAILFVTPNDALLVARQMLIMLTAVLASLALIYGVVHASSATRRGGIGGRSAQGSYDEHLILTWRRERTVFFGSNPPQEDASWIFKLRMAELERAKVARTSHARPWNRLGARLFDYAVWGLALACVIAQLREIGALPPSLVYWLIHPLLAPILICATWMPAEALFNAYARTTPGKWLFGVYLQYAISDAHAGRDPRAQLKRAWRRAFHVWWLGMGCGIPVLSPVMMAIAYETLVRKQETPWDAAEDCLVTHAPPSSINTATGVAGLVAMLWLYGVVWQPAVQDSITTARSSVIAVLPPSGFLSPASLSRGIGTISDAVHETRMLGLQHSVVSGVTEATSATTSKSLSNDPRIAASLPIDPDLAQLFADRRARIAYLRSEGLRMLDAQRWRRADELCHAWVDLDYGNSEAWRCVGQALQHEGRHQQAVNALRKAKQFDPDDRTLDTAIARSQHAIVAQFLSTAR